MTEPILNPCAGSWPYQAQPAKPEEPPCTFLLSYPEKSVKMELRVPPLSLIMKGNPYFWYGVLLAQDKIIDPHTSLLLDEKMAGQHRNNPIETDQLLDRKICIYPKDKPSFKVTVKLWLKNLKDLIKEKALDYRDTSIFGGALGHKEIALATCPSEKYSELHKHCVMGVVLNPNDFDYLLRMNLTNLREKKAIEELALTALGNLASPPIPWNEVKECCLLHRNFLGVEGILFSIGNKEGKKVDFNIWYSADTMPKLFGRHAARRTIDPTPSQMLHYDGIKPGQHSMDFALNIVRILDEKDNPANPGIPKKLESQMSTKGNCPEKGVYARAYEGLRKHKNPVDFIRQHLGKAKNSIAYLSHTLFFFDLISRFGKEEQERQGLFDALKKAQSPLPQGLPAWAYAIDRQLGPETLRALRLISWMIHLDNRLMLHSEMPEYLLAAEWNKREIIVDLAEVDGEIGLLIDPSKKGVSVFPTLIAIMDDIEGFVQWLEKGGDKEDDSWMKELLKHESFLLPPKENRLKLVSELHSLGLNFSQLPKWVKCLASHRHPVAHLLAIQLGSLYHLDNGVDSLKQPLLQALPLACGLLDSLESRLLLIDQIEKQVKDDTLKQFKTLLQSNPCASQREVEELWNRAQIPLLPKRKPTPTQGPITCARKYFFCLKDENTALYTLKKILSAPTPTSFFREEKTLRLLPKLIGKQPNKKTLKTILEIKADYHPLILSIKMRAALQLLQLAPEETFEMWHCLLPLLDPKRHVEAEDFPIEDYFNLVKCLEESPHPVPRTRGKTLKSIASLINRKLLEHPERREILMKLEPFKLLVPEERHIELFMKDLLEKGDKALFLARYPHLSQTLRSRLLSQVGVLKGIREWLGSDLDPKALKQLLSIPHPSICLKAAAELIQKSPQSLVDEWKLILGSLKQHSEYIGEEFLDLIETVETSPDTLPPVDFQTLKVISQRINHLLNQQSHRVGPFARLFASQHPFRLFTPDSETLAAFQKTLLQENHIEDTFTHYQKIVESLAEERDRIEITRRLLESDQDEHALELLRILFHHPLWTHLQALPIVTRRMGELLKMELNLETLVNLLTFESPSHQPQIAIKLRAALQMIQKHPDAIKDNWSAILQLLSPEPRDRNSTFPWRDYFALIAALEESSLELPALPEKRHKVVSQCVNQWLSHHTSCAAQFCEIWEKGTKLKFFEPGKAVLSLFWKICLENGHLSSAIPLYQKNSEQAKKLLDKIFELAPETNKKSYLLDLDETDASSYWMKELRLRIQNGEIHETVADIRNTVPFFQRMSEPAMHRFMKEVCAAFLQSNRLAETWDLFAALDFNEVSKEKALPFFNLFRSLLEKTLEQLEPNRRDWKTKDYRLNISRSAHLRELVCKRIFIDCYREYMLESFEHFEALINNIWDDAKHSDDFFYAYEQISGINELLEKCKQRVKSREILERYDQLYRRKINVLKTDAFMSELLIRNLSQPSMIPLYIVVGGLIHSIAVAAKKMLFDNPEST